MTAVTNTSPLNYLVQIGEAEALTIPGGPVYIPATVAAELHAGEAPEEVRRWIASPPNWLRVHPVTAQTLPTLVELHPGERDAIRTPDFEALKTKSLYPFSRTDHPMLSLSDGLHTSVSPGQIPLIQ